MKLVTLEISECEPFRTPQDVIECDFCNNTESVWQCNATVRETGCKEFWTESFYICAACREEIGS